MQSMEVLFFCAIKMAKHLHIQEKRLTFVPLKAKIPLKKDS